MAGVVWALGAAIAWSIGNLVAARGLPVLGVALGTVIQLLVSTAIVAAVTLPLDGPSAVATAPTPALVYFAASGLFHFLGGWGFMNASIRLIGPSRMSAITGVAPVFAVLLAVITLNESLNATVGAGIVLIVVGSYLIATS